MRQGGLIPAAGRVRSKTKNIREKKTNTSEHAPPKTHHEIHSSPAIATTLRRRAAKHVPCISPYSPASIDPGFVEIGLVQLALAISKSDEWMCYTNTDRHRQTDGHLLKKLKNARQTGQTILSIILLKY